MKVVITTLVLFGASIAQAGKCEAFDDGHRAFCEYKAKDDCVAHSTICYWSADFEQPAHLLEQTFPQAFPQSIPQSDRSEAEAFGE